MRHLFSTVPGVLLTDIRRIQNLSWKPRDICMFKHADGLESCVKSVPKAHVPPQDSANSTTAKLWKDATRRSPSGSNSVYCGMLRLIQGLHHCHANSARWCRYPKLNGEDAQRHLLCHTFLIGSIKMFSGSWSRKIAPPLGCALFMVASSVSGPHAEVPITHLHPSGVACSIVFPSHLKW